MANEKLGRKGNGTVLDIKAETKQCSWTVRMNWSKLPKPAMVRHAEVNSAFGVSCSGLIDWSNQTQVANLLRSSRPTHRTVAETWGPGWKVPQCVAMITVAPLYPPALEAQQFAARFKPCLCRPKSGCHSSLCQVGRLRIILRAPGHSRTAHLTS